MDTMTIAAMSTSLSSARLQMDASLCIAKKVMTQQETAAQGLLEMLPADPYSAVGQIINVKA